MGIPLRRGRRKRRSYADYRPPRHHQGPRNDPFRIIFYLLLIAGALWVYFHREEVRAYLSIQAPQQAEHAVASTAQSDVPTPDINEVLAETVAQAEQAYQEGRLTQAIDFYRQAAEIDPANVDYHFQIARLLLFNSAMQYGDQRRATLSEAEAAANDAINADPFNAAGYAILGKVYDWQNRPDQALSTIRQALDYDPNYAVGMAYYAEALVDLDRWDEALQTIEQALALAPNDVDVRRDYAYILERLGDYASAATQYEAALRLHPKLPYLLMALGRAYRELGRYTEAQDQFFAAQLIEPSNALIAFELGRTYESYIGDVTTALQYYQRAVELDETFGSAWLRLGALYFYGQSYAEAIAAYEQALALGATSGDLNYQLGFAYAQQGACAEAIPHLREAQAEAQDNQRVLDIIAQAYEACSQIMPTPLPITPTTAP